MKIMSRRSVYSSPEIFDLLLCSSTVLCDSGVSYGDEGEPGVDPIIDDDFII